MKRIQILAAAVALISLAAPYAVEAQLVSGMSVPIPFEFYVGTQKLPPGTYSVTRGTNSLVRISDHRGNDAMMLTTGTAHKSRNQEGGLVFNQYESRLFLTQIRWQDNPIAGEVTKSKLEVEFARNHQANRTLVASSANR
jgi:hypothetical protein